MTLTQLHPTGMVKTYAGSGWVNTGGASFWQSVSDASDATYISASGSPNVPGQIGFNLGTFTLPTNAVVTATQFRARTGRTSGSGNFAGVVQVYSKVNGLLYASPSTSFWAGSDAIRGDVGDVTYGFGPHAGPMKTLTGGGKTATPQQLLDFLQLYLYAGSSTNVFANTMRWYKIWCDVTYMLAPTATNVTAVGGGGSTRPQITWDFASPEGLRQAGYRVVVWPSSVTTDSRFPASNPFVTSFVDSTLTTQRPTAGSHITATGAVTSNFAVRNANDEFWNPTSDIPDQSNVKIFVAVADIPYAGSPLRFGAASNPEGVVVAVTKPLAPAAGDIAATWDATRFRTALTAQTHLNLLSTDQASSEVSIGVGQATNCTVAQSSAQFKSGAFSKSLTCTVGAGGGGALTAGAVSNFATSNTETVTTLNYTPPVGLLVALVGVGNGYYDGGYTTVAITDTLTGTGTWTLLKRVNTNGDGIAEIWCVDSSNTTAGTITATTSDATVDDICLQVISFTNAAPAVLQTGGTAGKVGSAYALSITTTINDSQVVGAFGRSTSAVTLTANGNTTIYGQGTGPELDTYAAFKATSKTGTPGTISLGFTNIASYVNAIALAEILPNAGGGGGTGSGNMSWETGALGDPSTLPKVLGSTQYAARVSFRTAVSARTTRVDIGWYTETELISISTGTGGGTASDATNWTAANLVFAATSPATATRASIVCHVAGCATSEVHYIDELQLIRGDTSYAWTRPGISSTSEILAQRTVDAGANWYDVPLSGNTIDQAAGGLISVYDCANPPNRTAAYRFAISGIDDYSNGTLSDWSPSTGNVTPTIDRFILRDPYDPLGELAGLTINEAKISQEAVQGVFEVIGEPDAIVISDVVHGAIIDLQLTFSTPAIYEAFRDLRDPPRPLLLQDDVNQFWWVMIGDSANYTLLHSVDRRTNQKRTANFQLIQITPPAGLPREIP